MARCDVKARLGSVWVLVASLGLGCSAEAPVEEASRAALERDVRPGQLVVPDPWPDGVGLPTPIVADVDGDGWADLVGGQAGECLDAYDCAYPGPGMVFRNSVLAVWRGGPAGFPAAPDFEVTSPDPIRFAHPAAVVGDSDGDGVTEVLVADASWNRGEGKVWLEAASPVPGPPQWTLAGGGWNMRLGGAVEPLGDANGDGYDDLMFGARTLGRVAVFYGGPGGFGAAPDWTSATLAYSAGTGLAAGDVDGDGYPDAFVGAPEAYARGAVPPWSDAVVFGFRGGPGGFGAAPDWTLTRAPSGVAAEDFGYQLRVLPDLNGDGYRELAVAAPGDGAVEVFEGGPAGPASAPTWTYAATGGRALAAGDVDGDGLTDLLMTGSNGVQVVLGVPGGLAPTVAYVMRGPVGSSCFRGVNGADVDTFEHSIQVADVDRDGRDDVVFGCATSTDWSEGSIWVAYGGVDADGDAVPDAVDCAPTDPDIYPGAIEIWYDGVDQSCDGLDDFDQDGDGLQASPWGLDEDDTDAAVTLSLVVSGSCAALLDLEVDGAAPGATVEFYEGRNDPGGTWHPPVPNPCRMDATLDLLTPTLLGSAVADGSGRAALIGVAPLPTACTDRVQALDLSTCTTSTAHTTPP